MRKRKTASKETREKISKALSGRKSINRFPDEKVFVENSTHPRHRVKQRLIQENLIPYLCRECGNVGEHNGKPLSLQLDHENGINNDNRIWNLRFLCPNCHSQQDTYASKNIVFKKMLMSNTSLTHM